jgi:hypothetical protein
VVAERLFLNALGNATMPPDVRCVPRMGADPCAFSDRHRLEDKAIQALEPKDRGQRRLHGENEPGN